jgi:hypothetical protein
MIYLCCLLAQVCTFTQEYLNVSYVCDGLMVLRTFLDDGGVRIWRNYTQGKPELVTAWQALSSLLPSTHGNGSGLVVNWEQQTGWLMASGDVRHIRVWDTQREMKLQVSSCNIDMRLGFIQTHSISTYFFRPVGTKDFTKLSSIP